MSDDEDGDDDVGYGKPPKQSRFQPGQSGNPKGRPRRARGLKAELRRELDELVDITEHGKAQKLPKRRVVLKSLIAKAAKGDVRAADRVIQYMIQLEGLEDQRPQRLSAADQQILDHLLGSDGQPKSSPLDSGNRSSDPSSNDDSED